MHALFGPARRASGSVLSALSHTDNNFLTCIQTLTTALHRLHNLHVTSSSTAQPQIALPHSVEHNDLGYFEALSALQQQSQQPAPSVNLDFSQPLVPRSRDGRDPPPENDATKTENLVMQQMFEEYMVLQRQHTTPMPPEETMPELFRRQLEHETRAREEALEKHTQQVMSSARRGAGEKIGPLRDHMAAWTQSMVKRLNSEMSHVRCGGCMDCSWCMDPLTRLPLRCAVLCISRTCFFHHSLATTYKHTASAPCPCTSTHSLDVIVAPLAGDAVSPA